MGRFVFGVDNLEKLARLAYETAVKQDALRWATENPGWYHLPDQTFLGNLHSSKEVWREVARAIVHKITGEEL
jgi:hypothetical protein